MHIALGAIAKNEGPYLLEWIAWHRRIGFDEILICDNDSDDGSSDLLAALDRAGIITHIPFPDTPGQRPQMYAYQELLSRTRGTADWLALFDLDEFLVPTGAQGLRDCLAAQPAKSGGVLVNWAMFGSSGQREPDDPVAPSPTLERFARRAEITGGHNACVKPILRPQTASSRPELRNPHALTLDEGFVYTDPGGMRIDISTRGDWGQSPSVNWTGLRLNHYATRSRSEYMTCKSARGDGINSRARPPVAFSSLDQNAVADPMPPDEIAALRAQIARLREIAVTKGGLAPDWAPTPLETAPPPPLEDRMKLDGLYYCAGQNSFVLDAAFVDDLGLPSIATTDLTLIAGGRALPVQRIEQYCRSDLPSRWALAHPMCGARVWFAAAATGTTGPVDLVAGFEPVAAGLTVTEIPAGGALPPLPHEAPPQG